MEKIKNKIESTGLTINSYLINKANKKDKDGLIVEIGSRVKKKQSNYLGFKIKKDLIEYIKSEIYGFDTDYFSFGKKIDEKEIKKVIIAASLKCESKIKRKLKLNVHLFPSYNKFINIKMSGASGYTPDSRNILIFISSSSGWRTALQNVIVHEIAHTQSFKYNKWLTLKDSLIFEGLAEHFREFVVGGKPSPWSIALSPNDCKYFFKKIKAKLNSVDEKLYFDIFLGAKKYPLWLGYSIGYQIIKKYFQFNKEESWESIFRLSPNEILIKSRY